MATYKYVINPHTGKLQKVLDENSISYLSTQVTNVLYVDGNRTDEYTENGSITKPFKKIQDALDKFEEEITTENFYMMRIVHLVPCIYNENIIIPPSRLTLFSYQAVINGNVTLRRNIDFENLIDPLTGTNTNRMWHNFRLDGGATRSSMNSDGGIMITGNLICSHDSDTGIDVINIFARNAYIQGGITPNNDWNNPTEAHGKLSIYLTNCAIGGNFQTSIVGGKDGRVTIGMDNCRLEGSFVKNLNATSSLNSGQIRFEEISSSSIYGIDLPYEETKIFTSDRVAFSNVRFHTAIALTAGASVTLKLDAHTYKTLMIENNPLVTNIIFELVDTAIGIANDSSVTGNTVKDALETLDSDITTLEARTKVYTFNLPTTSIANGESIQIHRFTVPVGKSVKVWSAGLSSESGTTVSGAKIQIYNEDTMTELYSTNSTFVDGNPITTLSVAEVDISIKILNDSGLVGNFNGFISITIE